jgi:glycosyltransferase involved in cell wall biosynthesis
MNRTNPQLSVIIATPDNYQTIRKTVSYLRAQTVKEQLEIVIVAPSREALGLEESELHDFGQFQVVEVGEIPSVGFANAAGVRHAQASVVVFAETHAYPEPEWAQLLITAHQDDWVAVGPTMVNGNPESIVSWASFLIAYSRWMAPITSGVIDDLPGHNSSYKRAMLLDYGAELDTLLETESILHCDLRAKGNQLYLESNVKTHHVNPTLPSSFLGELFYYGRLYAAARAKPWSWLRRLLYVLGVPLIPLIRLNYTLLQWQRVRQSCSIPLGVLLPILLGLIAASFGEMLGYGLGAGKAMAQMRDFEYHRERHLAKLNHPILP